MEARKRRERGRIRGNVRRWESGRAKTNRKGRYEEREEGVGVEDKRVRTDKGGRVKNSSLEKGRVVQYCRIYTIGTIREFRAAIMGETD